MPFRFENLSAEFCQLIKKQLVPKLERYLVIDSSMEVLGSHQEREATRIVDLVADHIFAALDPYVADLETEDGLENEDEFEVEEK